MIQFGGFDVVPFLTVAFMICIVAQTFCVYLQSKYVMEDTKEYAREHGYVETLFGRRCYVPGIQDKNPASRAFAERQAINAPLQGTAADIIKRAMMRLPGALAEAGLKTRMLLQVHDELIFEAPVDEAEQALALIRKIMSKSATLDVPLEVEANQAESWASAH